MKKYPTTGHTLTKIENNTKEKLLLNYKNTYNTYKLLFLSEPGTLFSFICSGFTNKMLYKASLGNYVVFLELDFFLVRTLFKLPSGKKIKLPIFVLGIVGRNLNMFHKYVIYGKYSKKAQLKKKKITVRGIAMNPVDHPNGGRTKTKQPFMNKYGKIAKKNK